MSQTLKQEQDALAAENVDLMQAVTRQRQQIKELMGGLESTMAHLQQAATTVPQEELDAMRDEMRNADKDMRAMV